MFISSSILPASERERASESEKEIESERESERERDREWARERETGDSCVSELAYLHLRVITNNEDLFSYLNSHFTHSFLINIMERSNI